MSVGSSSPLGVALSVVGTGGYTSGSGLLTVRAGDGAKFGLASSFLIAVVSAGDPSAFTIFKVTAITGDDLTVTALSGTTDRNYASGDAVGTAVLNVRAFGAIGDNTNDDTAAIQDAIDAAMATTRGGVVYAPKGVYKIVGMLSFSNNSQVQPIGIVGDPAATTVFNFYAAAATATYVSLTSNVATITTSSAHLYHVGMIVTIAGLANTTFNGTWTITAVTSTTFSFALTHADIGSTSDTGTVNPTYGIQITNAHNCYLDSLYLQGTADIIYGVNVSSLTQHFTMWNVWADHFYNGICIAVDTSDDVAETHLYDCTSFFCQNAGFYFGNGTTGNELDVRCFGCTANGGRYGVYLNAMGVNWYGGSTLGNSVSDFYRAAATGHPISIDGVRSEGSGQFWNAQDQATTDQPVSIRSVVVFTFTKSNGHVIEHNSATQITLENCIFTAGPVAALLSLGFDPDHPCPAVLTNVVTDNPTPIFNHGPHVMLTCNGLFYQDPCSSAFSPVATYGYYTDLPATFAGHVCSTGTVPTIAVGIGAGTGPTVSVAGTDTRGTITITTGTTPVASATVGTITFNATYGAAPVVVLTPANVNSAALAGSGTVYVDVATVSTSSFGLSVGSGALAAATTYKWTYHVVG